MSPFCTTLSSSSLQFDYLYNDSRDRILNLCYYWTDRRVRDLNYPWGFEFLNSLRKGSTHVFKNMIGLKCLQTFPSICFQLKILKVQWLEFLHSVSEHAVSNLIVYPDVPISNLDWIFGVIFCWFYSVPPVTVTEWSKAYNVFARS
jgi:hypothetical protein